MKKQKLPTPASIDKTMVDLAHIINHSQTIGDYLQSIVDASRNETTCPQGLLSMAWGLLNMADAVLYNAEHAAKYEDEANKRPLKEEQEDTASLTPYIRKYRHRLGSLVRDISSAVPVE